MFEKQSLYSLPPLQNTMSSKSSRGCLLPISWYLASFLSWDSSILVSHGTVGSTRMTCLLILDHGTMSVRRVVKISFWKLVIPLTLACISRSFAVARIQLVLLYVLLDDSSPPLMKLMNFGPFSNLVFFLFCVSKIAAISRRTWS